MFALWKEIKDSHCYVARSRLLNESTMREIEDRLGGAKLRALGLRKAHEKEKVMDYQVDTISGALLEEMWPKLIALKVADSLTLGAVVAIAYRYPGWGVYIALATALVVVAMALFMVHEAFYCARSLRRSVLRLCELSYDMKKKPEGVVGMFIPCDMNDVESLREVVTAMYALDILSHNYVAPVTSTGCLYVIHEKLHSLKLQVEGVLMGRYLKTAAIERLETELRYCMRVDSNGVELHQSLNELVRRIIAGNLNVKSWGRRRSIKLRKGNDALRLRMSDATLALSELFEENNTGDVALVQAKLVVMLACRSETVTGRYKCVAKSIRSRFSSTRQSNEFMPWAFDCDEPVSLETLRLIYPLMISLAGEPHIGNGDGSWFELQLGRCGEILHLCSDSLDSGHDSPFQNEKCFTWSHHSLPGAYVGGELAQITEWLPLLGEGIRYPTNVAANGVDYQIRKRDIRAFLTEKGIHWHSEENLRSVYWACLRSEDIPAALCRTVSQEVIFGRKFLRRMGQRILFNENKVASVNEARPWSFELGLNLFGFLNFKGSAGPRERDNVKTYLFKLSEVILACGREFELAAKYICYQWLFKSGTNSRTEGRFSCFFWAAGAEGEGIARMHLDEPSDVVCLLACPIEWYENEQEDSGLWASSDISTKRIIPGESGSNLYHAERAFFSVKWEQVDIQRVKERLGAHAQIGSLPECCHSG